MAHLVSETRPLTQRRSTRRQELHRGSRADDRGPRSVDRVQTKARAGKSQRGRQAPLVDKVRSYLEVSG